MKPVSKRAAALTQGAIRAMFSRATSMDNVISMGIGEPDMATPGLICEAAEKAIRDGKTHYTPNAGIPELRESIASSLEAGGMSFDPGFEIIITNGGMGALSLLISVLIDSGDEVLIGDPQWLNYASQIQYYGGRAVRVPVFSENRFEIRAADIEERITPKSKLIIINSPGNPTGAVLSRDILEEIAALAQKHDLYVVSDEVYNTLLYNETPFCSIGTIPGMKDRSITINSFSKAYAMTGWRIGYAAGPAFLIDRMTKAQESLNACASSVGQYAALCALDHPELAEEIRLCFARRRACLYEGLSRIPGFYTSLPDGAFYLFPDISSFSMSSARFCDLLLEEQHVVCIPGSAFGDMGEGYIRMSYTCEKELIEEALTRIARFSEVHLC